MRHLFTRLALAATVTAAFMASTLTSESASAEPSTVDPAVTQVIKAFARAGDARDLVGVQKATHKDFRVVFTIAGKPGTTVLSRQAYLDMMKAGKLGGGERRVKVEWTRVDGDLAYARLEMDRKDARFTTMMTLARGEAGWQIMQDSVVMAVKQ